MLYAAGGVSGFKAVGLANPIGIGINLMLWSDDVGVGSDIVPTAPVEMAKGGAQNKANEYSRAAQIYPDPCAWLRQQYDQASSNIERQKIKTAQKQLGCRQNSTLNDKCDKK